MLDPRFTTTGQIVWKDGASFLIARNSAVAQATAIMLNKGYISPRAFADGEVELIEREIRG